MSGVLWIVQDGVLGGPATSQTVPYLVGLAREGFRLSLLSFEKARFLRDRDRVASVAAAFRREGVTWVPLGFGEAPAAPRTLAQLGRAFATGRGLVRREGVVLVHARSYLPGLMALALRRPFLFDMRGLWPRERVDGGLWPEGGPAHRFGARLESALLEKASGIVVLAEGAREHLPEIGKPFRVIPTAVDLGRFRSGLPPPPGSEKLAARDVYVLSGALGTWYLLEEMLDLLALALEAEPRAHVLVLTEEDPAPALAGLAARGVSSARVTARGVPYAEVPAWLGQAAAGVFLIKAAPSKRASAPTKLGEFLACGVPVMISPGIGDTEALVTGTRTGVVVRELSPRGYGRALAELRELRREGEGLAERCRRVAGESLSLGAAVRAYADLYGDLVPRLVACAERPAPRNS